MGDAGLNGRLYFACSVNQVLTKDDIVKYIYIKNLVII